MKHHLGGTRRFSEQSARTHGSVAVSRSGVAAAPAPSARKTAPNPAAVLAARRTPTQDMAAEPPTAPQQRLVVHPAPPVSRVRNNTAPATRGAAAASTGGQHNRTAKSNRQLRRVASHSIELSDNSELSSEETEVVDSRSTHPTHADTNAVRRRKRGVKQAAAQQQREQGQRAAHSTTAAAAHAPPPPPTLPPRHRQRGSSAGTVTTSTTTALSAVACLVLLVACGAAVRTVASWRSSSSSSSAWDALAAAAVGAGGANNAPTPAPHSGGISCSWLSNAAGRLGGSSSSSSWLPTRLTSSFSQSARQVQAYVSSAAAAASGAVRGSFSSRVNAPPPHTTSNRGWPTPTTTRAAAASGGATFNPTGSSGDTSSSGGVAAGAIKLFAVVDSSASSPFKAHSPEGSKGLDWSANWGQVLQHMRQRLAWTDERFSLEVFTQDDLKSNAAARDSLAAALRTLNPPTAATAGGSSSPTHPIFLGTGVTDPEVAAFLAQATSHLPTSLYWNSDPSLTSSNRVDGYAPATAGPVAKLLAQSVGFSREAKAAEVLKTLDILWERDTSDDLLYIWLVLLNQYVTPVPLVANTTKGTDAKSLYCMIKNCGQKIVDCVSDKTCKAGLDCLQGCAFNDQVCQYRCIVSYETPQFEAFALCILQLHNCRGLSAEIPMRPDPAPMTQWRGQALTHEAAEDLFIGWLADGPQLPPGAQQKLQPYSWLVAAGKNPAYDAFGCQHQLYYRGKGKGQMWYEPVFRVTTLEGEEVWRRRRYRVRRGESPGTFYYSVLDNGVTSNEYWRIIDCAEDLTYCLFYYSGAAAAAGMSYTGAVLGTRDGAWPVAYTDRIHGALRSAGIEPWELSMPDNSRCGDAPLTAAAAA